MKTRENKRQRTHANHFKALQGVLLKAQSAERASERARGGAEETEQTTQPTPFLPVCPPGRYLF